MGIVEIYSRPTYKSLSRKTKEWLISELMCMYEFSSKQTVKIIEYQKKLEELSIKRDL